MTGVLKKQEKQHPASKVPERLTEAAYSISLWSLMCALPRCLHSFICQGFLYAFNEASSFAIFAPFSLCGTWKASHHRAGRCLEEDQQSLEALVSQ